MLHLAGLHCHLLHMLLTGLICSGLEYTGYRDSPLQLHAFPTNAASELWALIDELLPPRHHWDTTDVTQLSL